jgi:hypothetical protein
MASTVSSLLTRYAEPGVRQNFESLDGNVETAAFATAVGSLSHPFEGVHSVRERLASRVGEWPGGLRVEAPVRKVGARYRQLGEVVSVPLNLGLQRQSERVQAIVRADGHVMLRFIAVSRIPPGIRAL